MKQDKCLHCSVYILSALHVFASFPAGCVYEWNYSGGALWV